MSLRISIALVVLVLASACMSTPRNGQHYADRRDEIFFSGRVIVAGQRVDVSVRNRLTGGWEPFQSFHATTTPIVDEAGVTWYEWAGTARLPPADAYWTMIAGTPTDAFSHLRAHFRAADSSGHALDSFDVSADPCISEHYDEGVFSVIEHCRSASTPVASITAGCGSFGMGCCLYGICSPGTVCNSAGECIHPAAPSSYTPVEDYPFQSTVNWRLHPQGLAADDAHWFVVHDDSEWLIEGDPVGWIGYSPLGTPLDRDLPQIVLPPLLEWGHIGDPDVFRGRLYIPLEGGPRGFGVASVDTIDLRTMGSRAPVNVAVLPPGRAHAAWVAISPANGRMYTAGGYDAVTAIDELDFTDGPSGLSITPRRQIPLTGLPHGSLRRVQGGAFGPEGTMYLVAWDEDEGRGGVFVFDPEGHFLQRIAVAYDDSAETLEGIAVADMDGGQSPNIAGDVHVVMFQRRYWASNRLYLKHFRANP